MSATRGAATRELGRLFSDGTLTSLTDGELLERFVAGCDGSERAFAALVDRHGPVVFRVCRRLLGDADEAADAFQATFLVLARRARSIRAGASVGSWLYGVAVRVAGASRSASARRRRHERRAARVEATSDHEFRDWQPVLHEEVGRLPDKFRTPLVLCYFEGLSHEDVAHQLGWPLGTVRSRIARGRERLRGRLVGRGVGLSALAWASVTAEANAAVPPSLAESTVRAATQFAAMSSATAAGLGSASAVALSQGMLDAMLLTKLKIGAVVAIAAAATFLAAGALAQSEARGRPAEEPHGPAAGARDGPPADERDASSDSVGRGLRPRDDSRPIDRDGRDPAPGDERPDGAREAVERQIEFAEREVRRLQAELRAAEARLAQFKRRPGPDEDPRPRRGMFPRSVREEDARPPSREEPPSGIAVLKRRAGAERVPDGATHPAERPEERGPQEEGVRRSPGEEPPSGNPPPGRHAEAERARGGDEPRAERKKEPRARDEAPPPTRRGMHPLAAQVQGERWKSEVWGRLTSEGIVGRLDGGEIDPPRMVDRLFRRYCDRLPSEAERAALLRPFGPGAEKVELAPEEIIRRLVRAALFDDSPLWAAILERPDLIRR